MPPNKEAREAIAVAVFATVLATFVAYRVSTPAAPPPPPTVRLAPEPTPTPDPGFDPEVWRLRNLAQCVEQRDNLRVICERDQTLAACDRWVEATFICSKYDLPSDLMGEGQ